MATAAAKACLTAQYTHFAHRAPLLSHLVSFERQIEREIYIDNSGWSVAKAMLSASGFTVYNCTIRSDEAEKTTILEIDLWSMLLSFAGRYRRVHVQQTIDALACMCGDERRQRVCMFRAVFRVRFDFLWTLARENWKTFIFYWKSFRFVFVNRFVSEQ